ncbi:MAG: ribonuclease E inhibitor RraB [Pseudomonadota bacterium]
MPKAALKPEDKLVLSAMRAQGDKKLATPRHTLLYFHAKKRALFGAKKRLAAVAEAAEANGWKAAALDRKHLVVEDEVPVSAAAVAQRTAWAEELASHYGVEFDGWEAQIIQHSAPDPAISDT